jgi:hypothetical protein
LDEKDDEELNSLLQDIIPDKVLDSFTSFDNEVNMNALVKQPIETPQLETPSGLESGDAGAFKFYTAFADELLADVDDEADEEADISISYDEVLNKLNFKISELNEDVGTDKAEKADKDKPIVENKPAKVLPRSPAKLRLKNSTPPKTASPFMSIENKTNNEIQSKSPSKIPLKDANMAKPRPATSLKKTSEPTTKTQRSASTYYEDRYSFDSEETSFVGDMNLEMKLKEEQKKRKMTDELLDQLQISYNQLLEKHALAENFIDTLRLGAKLQVQEEIIPGVQRVGLFSSVFNRKKYCFHSFKTYAINSLIKKKN